MKKVTEEELPKIEEKAIEIALLKAEAYDIYAELQKEQNLVAQYTKERINPLSERLMEVNKKINEVRSSDSSV